MSDKSNATKKRVLRTPTNFGTANRGFDDFVAFALAIGLAKRHETLTCRQKG
jgi:hypothetical protein